MIQQLPHLCCLFLFLLTRPVHNKSLKGSLSFLGQPSRQSEVDDGTQSPRSGVFRILRASNEPDIRDVQSPCGARLHGRPRDGGPDGASDTAPIVGKEREFTPVLGKVTAMDSSESQSPRKHFTPERDFGVLSGQRTKDRAVKAYNMAGSVLKRADNSDQDTSVALAEKERQRNYGMHKRALKEKPLASHKRGAPSPAFSVKSYESDQYSELPTVIHVSRRESSGSKDSSIPSHTSGAKELTISPVTSSVSDMRCRPSTQNRMTKLASRDKERSSSPSLPSKPRIDVRSKRAQNSS